MPHHQKCIHNCVISGNVSICVVSWNQRYTHPEYKDGEAEMASSWARNRPLHHNKIRK